MESKLKGKFNLSKRTGDYFYAYRQRLGDEGQSEQDVEKLLTMDDDFTNFLGQLSYATNKLLSMLVMLLFWVTTLSLFAVNFDGAKGSIAIGLFVIAIFVATYIAMKVGKFNKRIRKGYYEYMDKSFKEMINDKQYIQAFMPTIWVMGVLIIALISKPTIFVFWALFILLMLILKRQSRFEEFLLSLNSLGNLISEGIHNLVEKSKASKKRKEFKKRKESNKRKESKEPKALFVTSHTIFVRDMLNTVVITDESPNNPRRLYEFLDIKKSDEKKLAFKIGRHVSIKDRVEISELKTDKQLSPKKKAMLAYAKDAISTEHLLNIYKVVDQIKQLERDIAYEKELKRYEKQFSDGFEDNVGNGMQNDIVESLEKASKQIDEYLKENQGEMNKNLDKIQEIIKQFEEK